MSSAQHEPALILVIDLDPVGRSQLQQELELAGYRVLGAEDEQAGLDLLQQFQPGLVILNHHSAINPELTYCAKLCTLQESTRGSVLLLVDLAIPEILEQALAAGAIDIIPYPYEGVLLRQRVRQALELQRLQKQLQEEQRTIQTRDSHIKNLERLNGLKDEFLNTVIHELRTPLTNMKVASQLLEMQIQSAQKSWEDHPAAKSLLKATYYLQTLKTECERETVLINNLLDLQHLDAGVYPLELSPIDLKLWIPQIAQPFQHSTTTRQQILQIHLVDNLPPLISSAMSLERVLNELLHNACKYTPPGETIQISARKQANWIQLTVSNSGVEIPITEHARIFDKFYRIPRSDQWKQGGSGLGLALVKKLVTHLGGTIQLQSEAGQTAFIIQLPVSGPAIAADSDLF